MLETVEDTLGAINGTLHIMAAILAAILAYLICFGAATVLWVFRMTKYRDEEGEES